jgi:hypothetical protein
MLRSISGKRDLGQCEVSRLLLSEPLYHCSFTYVYQSLDLHQREVNFDNNADDTAPATKQNLLDIFAKRDSIEFLKPYVDSIINFLDFLTRFCIVKGNLRLRLNSSKIVVITNPRVRYNSNNLEYHKKYCFYQIITLLKIYLLNVGRIFC